ncbi:MAG: vitamin B12-dependent ribonucleotide reductase [Sedimentisphaerales bacterium]|nr:vitamin B12-dependent ribonucleotide reductase [Sedimentisphaerales bacterium]MBN2841578.1 vitamin B12-dependent ribonucleotide reductase [Sedimentisphaerales bacterium]
MKDAAKDRSSDAKKSQEITKDNTKKAMNIDRYFSDENISPFDQVKWIKRNATISDEKGNVVFEQKDAEVPEFYSQLATKVIVSKYFYGENGTDEREKSLKELIHRVTRTIANWGLKDGLFKTQQDAETYYDELTWLCLNQYASFNSPVWFNVGLYDVKGIAGSKHNHYWNPETNQVEECPNTYQYPQSSACFIQSVQDTMEDIMALAVSEAMLFKHGSGTGTDLSTLRSSREKLSGGGKPSGPLSFMRVYDQIAAVVKSGGKTRRAAKMQSLKIHHPDIYEFITCKTKEEKKAWALIEHGYSGEFNGEAYNSIMFQNSNLSVRLTDDFMEAVEQGTTYNTLAVTTGEPVESLDARKLMHAIAEGTHICGDPGVQYDTIINRWHTCPNSGRINASNPCSEYMFVDNSACNLASLNLMKFRQADGKFDIASYKKAVRILIIAQEILVDHGSYPTAEIARNSHDFRPLGLGYANLGSLLMSLGIPYDSNKGRALAGAITAILTGTAYTVSAELANVRGVFNHFKTNEKEMLHVIEMHRTEVENIDCNCPDYLLEAAREAWNDALAGGKKYGFRNAQTTVLAPTGTIGFMMDCDTTGIEPDIALVKYKQLAGGGMLKIVNRTVHMALESLGYSIEEIESIKKTIEEDDTIETSKVIKSEHLPVFDCAFKAVKGKRSIQYMGHVRMMAAAQPFISGAISKTVNMPNESSIDDVQMAYTEGWKLGLKALAIYRDGSKRTQPLNTSSSEDKSESEITENIKKQPASETETAAVPERRPQRLRLPQTRRSITHKFDVGGHEGYLTVGLYEDGSPGELFITMAKEGSTVGGLMDAFGTCISMALQYGVPLSTLVAKFSHARFEPAGMTNNRDIPMAKSLIDYIARWLGITFIEGFRKANTPDRGEDEKKSEPIWPVVGNRHKDVSDRSQQEKLAQIGNRIDEIMQMADKSTTEKTLVNSDGSAQMKKFNDQFSHFQSDAPVCDNCGSIAVRNGNCYKCFNCGNSLGCS